MPTTVETLQSALTDIEADIATTEASIATNEASLATLTATLDGLRSDLARYTTIRNDLLSSIQMLTPEEVDENHPDEAEEITDLDPEDIDEDDYGEFIYDE